MIASIGKQFNNVIATTKFSAEIETNIAIRGRSGKAVEC
jgi:hypothetical protein